LLLGAVEEGVPVQMPLGKFIRAMGVKEFAAKVRMSDRTVLRAINPHHTGRRTRSIGSCERSSCG
jgi:hypothetical protein